MSEARPVVAGARVRGLAGELAGLVGELDADVLAGLAGRDAADLTAVFAEIERLAGAGKTLAAGRVAESGHYRVAGFPSAQQWLAAVTKDGAGEAGRTIATAAHLGVAELAPARAAFVGGALTAAQAGEIATAAAHAPGEQARLLAMAQRETTKRLRDECRKIRLADKAPEDPEARRRRITDEMRFTHRDRGDGMSELSATMPTSWLVLMLGAVRSQCDAVFANARAAGRHDPHAAYLVEALVTLLLIGPLTTGGGQAGDGEAGEDGEGAEEEAGEDGGGAEDPGSGGAEAGDCGGAGGGAENGDGAEEGVGEGSVEDLGAGGAEDPGGGGSPPSPATPGASPFDDPLYGELLAAIHAGPPPQRPSRVQRRKHRGGRCRCGGRVAPRAKILVRVDQAALLRGWARGDETCDIPGVGPVPVATVRELWPAAVVKAVVTNGVDVANVTHLGRRATEAMATAMQWTTPQCTNIACDNYRFVQIDHRLGFANTHRTRLDELDPLCSQCHPHKTNENWQLVRGSGRRRFVPPDHPDHPDDPPTPRRR